MGQQKGKTGNPAGRPKGTPNKATAELKGWISNLINKNRVQLEKDLKRLEPKDRWLVVEKLMNYTVPKMQSVEAKIDIEKLSEDQLDLIIASLTENLNKES